MPKANKDYQQLKQELQELLDWFDHEDVDLDQAAAKYQQALAVLKELEVYLKTAENKIIKLDPKFKI